MDRERFTIPLKWHAALAFSGPFCAHLLRVTTVRVVSLVWVRNKGGMGDEQGHFPAVCNKSFVAQASDMPGALSEQFFLISL